MPEEYSLSPEGNNKKEVEHATEDVAQSSEKESGIIARPVQNKNTAATTDTEDASSSKNATAPETEASKPAPPKFCTKCGAELPGGNAFCIKCGAPVESFGAELGSNGGEMAQETSSALQAAGAPKKEINATTSEKPQKHSLRNNRKKKVIAAAAVAVAVIAALIVVPPLLRTPDELFAAGEYRAAYEKSIDDDKPEMLERIIEKGKYDVAYSLTPTDDGKKKVLLGACAAGKFEEALQLAETDEAKQMISVINGICYVFKAEVLDNLKDSDSFVLKKAWYANRNLGYALQVQASNSYGQPVQEYYYFKYSSDKGRFEYYNDVYSLEDETIYKYADSYDEKLVKRFNNLTRDYLDNIMLGKYAIDSDAVDAVNKLFAATKFKDISLAPSMTVKEFGDLGGGKSA